MSIELRDAPNINAVWCRLIVEELARLGVRDVAVSPGSRNTPLIAALAGTRGENLRVTSVVDERAAGFFALGCARSGRPAAVVTTSGTAVMNLLPAVTEARRSGAPLLVLSSDRPPQLRDCGANQTIDQIGPMAPVVKWQHDLPAPDDRLPARLALAAVDEAVRVACAGWPGPVQLNCAFDEPLAPSEAPWDDGCLEGLRDWLAGSEPFVRNVVLPAELDTSSLLRAVEGARRGLLVVGNTTDGAAVLPLAAKLNWPVIADPASSIRTGDCPDSLVRRATLFNEWPEPDFVLQFGTRLVSRKIEQWLEDLACGRIVVDPADERRNPGHAGHTRITADIDAVAQSVAAGLAARPAGEWTAQWLQRDERIGAVVDEIIDRPGDLTEALVAREVARAQQRIFAGNSMPIRHFGLFADGSSRRGEVATSRGASGIDGVLATACGTACGAEEPIVLLIGDLSLLHDLNSLALVRRSRQKVLVVVINNGGGGIFDHLPVARYPEVMSPLCDASHDLEFAGVAAHFGLPAWRSGNRREWTAAWAQAQAAEGSCLVEAICVRGGHGAVMREIRERLADG